MIKLISPNFSDLYEPNIEIGQFPDGDSHVRIPDLGDCRGNEVMLMHRLYPSQNSALTELLLVLGTLASHNCQVNLVIPYMPYARQDKKKLDGEVASAHVLCEILAKIGVKKLITFDCHFLKEEGETIYHNLLIRNISMNQALIEEARQFFAGEPFEVVGPDGGSAYLVEGWGGNVMTKVRRDYQGNKINYREIDSITCEIDVAGKNVLLLDDMISSGSTMIKALEKMKDCGAKRLAAAATHGLFLHNSLDKLRNLSDAVFSSDTIPSSMSKVSINPTLLELITPVPKLF